MARGAFQELPSFPGACIVHPPSTANTAVLLQPLRGADYVLLLCSSSKQAIPPHFIDPLCWLEASGIFTGGRKSNVWVESVCPLSYVSLIGHIQPYEHVVALIQNAPHHLRKSSWCPQHPKDKDLIMLWSNFGWAITCNSAVL